MKCDQCQSDNVVKASVAYQMGTSSGTLGSVGIGAADGMVGVGLGRSGGRITSDFAQRFKPPSTFPGEFGCAFAAFFAVFFLIAYIFNPPSHNTLWAILLIGSGLLAGYGIFRAMKPSMQAERRGKIAKYDRLWVCLRCGRTADKDEFAKEA